MHVLSLRGPQVANRSASLQRAEQGLLRVKRRGQRAQGQQRHCHGRTWEAPRPNTTAPTAGGLCILTPMRPPPMSQAAVPNSVQCLHNHASRGTPRVLPPSPWLRPQLRGQVPRQRRDLVLADGHCAAQ